MTRRRAERELILAARRMAADGLVTGWAGNVSIRTGDRLRITPSRTAYPTMRRRDLVSVDIATGAVARGTPSLELPMHLAIYRARPDVHAILHTHSPAATAWSFLGRPLAPQAEELAYYGVGEVRCSPPAPAGSAALADHTAATLGDSRAALLGEHGVVAVAGTPADALTIATAVERHAQMAWYLRAGIPPLGDPLAAERLLAGG